MNIKNLLKQESNYIKKYGFGRTTKTSLINSDIEKKAMLASTLEIISKEKRR